MKILFTINFKDYTTKNLDTLIPLAKSLNADVTLLHVITSKFQA